MQQQWRIRVRGKQRKQVSIELLIAAVMALGEELAKQQRQAEQHAAQERSS
jgi:hypothetical protein